MSMEEIHIHLHIHTGPEEKLDQILSAVSTLQQQGEQTMIDVQAITDAVSVETTVSQSAVTLIQSLAAQITDLANTVAQEPAVQEALNTLAANLTSSTTALSDAVVANTPVAPVPLAEPPAEPTV